MNPFKATGLILNSYVSVITSSAQAIEKTVNLVTAEIDLLAEEQNIRITTTRSELAALTPPKQIEQSNH